ncbi:PIN domain-like protein [Mycena pura]|uniref:PIN domain-like protein n=1 Tax=Mycena pura TaxID=153505 RepID=A0AAD6YKW5_9AGAR|nr:PIN domain-like protein [Mycena pura]
MLALHLKTWTWCLCLLATVIDHIEAPLFLTSMGIPGLWKELESVEEKVSLHNLAVGTGFIGNATGARAFKVGIDASGWMYRATFRHGGTESPELVALFSRCSRLFRLPFIPIFVFDGPGRPSMKRGKLVRGNDHRLAHSFQLMLDGFGFEWITAPGEAEAQLSEMSVTGRPIRVDAILTDDADSFVFGASVILRIRSEDNENYQASRYSAFDISQSLGLTREDFILIAILAGGDYSNGLEKCGVTTAIALARAGLGRRLVSGLTGDSHRDSFFLKTWRELLCAELSTNSSGFLTHRHQQLAARVPNDFPDLDIINLYRHPLVNLAPATRSLDLHPPNLDVLARFAEDHFRWGDSVGILTHFADQLFAGFVIRELVQQALALDRQLLVSSVSIIKQIVGHRRHRSTGYLWELRVVLSINTALLLHTLQAIDGKRDPVLDGAKLSVKAWMASKLPKVRVWVAKSMVEHVYPSMVLDYISNPQSTSKMRPRKARSVISPEPLSPINGQPDNAQASVSSQISLATLPEKRYTAMSVSYQGREVLELITDSEGEL